MFTVKFPVDKVPATAVFPLAKATVNLSWLLQHLHLHWHHQCCTHTVFPVDASTVILFIATAKSPDDDKVPATTVFPLPDATVNLFVATESFRRCCVPATAVFPLTDATVNLSVATAKSLATPKVPAIAVLPLDAVNKRLLLTSPVTSSVLLML